MLDNGKLELAGPVGVIGAICCAELGAHALAVWPTSAALWYLNLELFRSFRYSFNGLGAAQWFGSFSFTIGLAISLLLLVCVGLLAKVRLALAIASNLSFLYSACLVCGSYTASATTASFKLSGLCSPAGLFAAAILVLSLLSSTVSHRSYWRDIFA